MKYSNIIAIVIGIGSYNDLGLIRSCGEEKIPSIYIFHGKCLIVPIQKSRYVMEYYEMCNITEIGSILSKLHQNKPNVQFVIFPTSDTAVIEMDRIQGNLPNCLVTSHAYGHMSIIMEKLYMSQTAIEVGLTTPETQCIDLSVVTHCQIDYPVILKPAKSIDGEKSDITVCGSDNEFHAAIDVFKAKGYKQILVQQYIHNNNSKEIGISGVVYKNGEIEIRGMIEKWRNRGMVNNYGCFVPEIAEDIVQKLKQFFLKCGYSGIFDTDFIMCDNKLFFLECNFRNGAYGYCITKAGFNMPYSFICDVIGLEGPRKQLKKTVFMEERTDVLNILDGGLPFFSWLKDVFHTDVFLWWNNRDPRPMIRIPYSVKKLFMARD